MKPQYGAVDFKAEAQVVLRKETLAYKMDKIPCEYAAYHVDDMGHTFLRIFIYPTGDFKAFNDEQVRMIRKLLGQEFLFEDRFYPVDSLPSDRDKYCWVRDLRKDTGTVLWTRRLENFFENPRADVYFLIERAPLGECKLLKKEVVVTQYEMHCEGDPNENVERTS
jgi:hypothetical protein